MSKNIKYIIVIIILVIYIFKDTFYKNINNTDSVKIDSVKVFKEIKQYKGEFKSVKPPVTVINNYISNDKQLNDIILDLKNKYGKKADSLTILKELLKATQIREYKEVFEDSIITATINTRTKGYLESLDFKYKVKPRKISFYEKTTTKKIIPKFSILLGARLTTGNNLQNTSLDLNLGFQNKKGNVIEVGVNTNKQLVFGYKLNLFTKY